MTEPDYGSAVALVGLSGRFPGARSVEELWANLGAGVPGLRELGEDELRDAGVGPGQLADPRYVRVGGHVADLDLFDAAVFGISPREAETMDPQHRLFLECAWEALETAGYCPTDTPGQVAVFGGSGFPDYLVQNIQHVTAEPGGALLVAVGNERDSLASLVSYKLGLRGPSIAVQTFCSTSLVAVHLACQSLLTYECDMALAGGAFLPLPQPAGYLHEPGGITSPDGRVRSLDAEASGTVMGSGVGVVALKRMTDALADGDVIHAVVLGSATNNDGRVRAGYTAPGVDGQAEVIDAALGVAGVDPASIGYVECHATGTMLGDSIEIAAMNRVFTQPRETPLVLGTLKPVLGHLDRASGVTGLLRAALSLEHGVLPGTPGWSQPNPALATALDRMTVLPEARPWPEDGGPRRAGVSSFGLGGTNAHVVLEQAPVREDRPARPGPHLLTFSAADDGALTALTGRLHDHLSSPAADAADLADVADVAWTLQTSRGGFGLRRAVVCADRDDAVAALADPGRWVDGRSSRRNPPVELTRTATELPAAAWSGLAAAIERLLGVQAAATDAATVTDALAEGLRRLGVRVGAATPAAPGSVPRPRTDGGSVPATVPAAVPVEVAPPADGEAAAWLLTTVAALWQAGCTLDWSVLHGGQGRRVQLPTYPFQRRRHWVDSRGPGAWAAPADEGRTWDRSRWTHLPTWGRRPFPLTGLDERVRGAGPWLVLSADARGDAVAARLLAAGAEVTTVRPDRPRDLAGLLTGPGAPPRTVVHALALASPEAGEDPVAHFDTELDRGYGSVLAIARELVDDTGTAPVVSLVALAPGAVGVTGADLRHPEHAALAGLLPSLAQENPRLTARSVDVDDPGDDAGALARQAVQVLAAAVAPHEGPVAVRSGETWLRRYEPHPVPEPAADERPVRPGDTVLITGGLGDVGLTLARHLATRYACRLVLTAHSPIPPPDEWDDYLAAVPPGGERTARHIRSIRDLRARGAEVLAVCADAGDVVAMRAVVAAAVERFGRIDVAVHGAGTQSGPFFAFAHQAGPHVSAAHFRSKVHGFHALQQALGEQAPDRRITLSSLAAVLGGMTLGPYAAANAALDAYATAARRDGDGRWVTVDWDTWAVDPDRLAGHSGTVTDFAMAPDEAVDVFERALSAGDAVGHLVISTGSLEARVEQWVLRDVGAAGSDDDDGERHPRPELATPFVEPREGTEATLAAIWSRVLRIEPIGAVDNFFELGGHSLIAIDLTGRIRAAVDAAVPITALLEHPTVRELAALVDAQDAEPAEAGADPGTPTTTDREADRAFA